MPHRFTHHTQAEVDAARRQHPKCWLVEVHKGNAVALIAIPARPGFLGKPLATLPGFTVDALDGRIITRPA